MNAHDQDETVQVQDSEFIAECQVTVKETSYEIIGSFHAMIPFGINHELEGAGNALANSTELDRIEQHIEQFGQQFKRIVCRETLEAADENNVRLFRLAQPRLRKHGKSDFTIIAKCGRIRINRQRMLDSQTGKTMTPSAIVWGTSQNQHVTQQVVEAACDASQAVSYRKAAKQLADESGEAKLLSTTTVWNKKQKIGKELEQKQNTLIEQALKEQVLSQHKQDVPSLESVSTDAKPRRIAENTIQVQLDEVLTKSQEAGKKTNQTYTATLETSSGECFYLAAKSSQKLISLVTAQLTLLGLFFGKRLEVISDGARWIGDWVGGIKDVDVDVEHILCWYHLCKRIYEGLGAMGLTKEKRKMLERDILGHLWRGETAQAVWILWELRASARIPQRIDDLMGYLLRKKRIIANYADRREQGLWLASTRVEKWNDVAVSQRCKHRGMSWTAQGVLAIALYAALQKRKAKQTITQTAQLDGNFNTTP